MPSAVPVGVPAPPHLRALEDFERELFKDAEGAPLYRLSRGARKNKTGAQAASIAKVAPVAQVAPITPATQFPEIDVNGPPPAYRSPPSAHRPRVAEAPVVVEAPVTVEAPVIVEAPVRALSPVRIESPARGRVLIVSTSTSSIIGPREVPDYARQPSATECIRQISVQTGMALEDIFSDGVSMPAKKKKQEGAGTLQDSVFNRVDVFASVDMDVEMADAATAPASAPVNQKPAASSSVTPPVRNGTLQDSKYNKENDKPAAFAPVQAVVAAAPVSAPGFARPAVSAPVALSARGFGGSTAAPLATPARGFGGSQTATVRGRGQKQFEKGIVGAGAGSWDVQISDEPAARNQAYPATRTWDAGKAGTAAKRTSSTRVVFASAPIATAPAYNRSAAPARIAVASAPVTTLRKDDGSFHKGLKDSRWA